MERTRITDRLDNSVPRCKNNCGFAGNANWSGYCSMCYKNKFGSLDVPAHNTKQPTNIKPIKESRKSMKSSKSLTLSATDKPQTKKPEEGKSKIGLKLPRTKITMNSPHKQSATTEVKTDRQNSLASLERVNIPFQEVTAELNDLLSSVKRSQAQDIVDSTKAFMTQFQSPDCAVHPEETVKKIQNYFLAMSYSLYNTDTYKSLSVNTKDSLFLALENYVITHVYKSIFCLPSTDDEFLDSSLRRQMLCLSWITTENIDCHLQLDKTEVKHAVQLCKEEIWSLDKRYTPRQKLSSIVSLSKHINNALHCSQGHAASADDFLPALIFILIQSAPPFLASNVRFIERFAPADLVNSGESAYYFTNFLGAVNFLENVSCDQLKHVTPELFDEMAVECMRKEDLL
ncbi:Rab5 GDP/GTP exchange factor-like [Oopsacas minuta]|uniref:Rab5 GDP/GTP exchange factor-like n=1 Tax=Oopsacas minuta TaxID=111878 RepID=A0AAV7JD44_9METZ|nr:Rab5 GDP/GTP exchange factor-like [Oopsacas minuta]